MRSAIAGTPFTIGPDRIRHSATASLGVAVGDDGSAVFGKADEALYRAKAEGRDRVVRAELTANVTTD